MHGLRFALLLAAATVLYAGHAAALNYAQETLDRYFRIEFEVAPKGARPVVSGYVYNLNPGTPAERMQLSIESLDASGNVVGKSSTWVLGNVPPGNRAYFTAAAAAPGASYRVQVLSFDWGSRGGSSM
jgi:hypothetical protein